MFIKKFRFVLLSILVFALFFVTSCGFGGGGGTGGGDTGGGDDNGGGGGNEPPTYYGGYQPGEDKQPNAVLKLTENDNGTAYLALNADGQPCSDGDTLKGGVVYTLLVHSETQDPLNKFTQEMLRELYEYKYGDGTSQGNLPAPSQINPFDNRVTYKIEPSDQDGYDYKITYTLNESVPNNNSNSSRPIGFAILISPIGVVYLNFARLEDGKYYGHYHFFNPFKINGTNTPATAKWYKGDGYFCYGYNSDGTFYPVDISYNLYRYNINESGNMDSNNYVAYNNYWQHFRYDNSPRVDYTQSGQVSSSSWGQDRWVDISYTTSLQFSSDSDTNSFGGAGNSPANGVDYPANLTINGGSGTYTTITYTGSDYDIAYSDSNGNSQDVRVNIESNQDNLLAFFNTMAQTSGDLVH